MRSRFHTIWDRYHFAEGRRNILRLFESTNRREAVKLWAEDLIARMEPVLTKFEQRSEMPQPRKENISPDESVDVRVLTYVTAMGIAYIDAGRPADSLTLLKRTIAANQDRAPSSTASRADLTSRLSPISAAAREAGYIEVASEMEDRLSQLSQTAADSN
jgi:hypothetical protein